jgi:hypothetical protein
MGTRHGLLGFGLPSAAVLITAQAPDDFVVHSRGLTGCHPHTA